MGLGHDYPGAYARAGNLRTGHLGRRHAQRRAPIRSASSARRLTPSSGGLPHLAVKVSLAKTGARQPLAIPQATFDDDDREIVEVVGLAAAREMELRGKSPEDASHPSMYPPVKYPEYRWGMAVDSDACTGCQACVVACSAENNVPVVGKAQVAYGRAQQWIRLERWEHGPKGKTTNVFQPMFCQHCEIAPCEPVCPVYAAYHTKEGLNAQVYNRCVGTRYCGNNCPYHVRRFNWFNYSWTAPLDIQLNPDVTVRQLGVMEKCTMCLQRIEKGKNEARDAGRTVKDGDVQTACQQTCPTQAITFGNLKDGGGARVQALGQPAELPRAARAGHEAGRHLSRQGGARRGAGPRGREGAQGMSVASPPGQPSWSDVNRDVIRTVGMPGNTYFAWMCFVGLVLGCGVAAWAWQIWTGMGAAGKRTPQMWAMYITTFVFWIGIGHAGTLISAVLYLFRAKWRTSIYRGAEAMTVFAVMTAGLFPLIHAGRMWFAYWLMPYPNQRYLWPNFKSPLVWDVFAISTYLTISVVFFIVGLVPDIAALRDNATGFKKKIYTVMALGWEGSDSQWRHYRRAYGLFAALATPLVLSVHSVVSFDFAMALVPGWHSTLFAPFFVDGAIFSGFAMVLILILPMRYIFNWYAYITDKHLDAMAKLILVTSLVLSYFYICEVFTAWYSGDHFERASVFAKASKQYAWAYWGMYFCNSLSPLVFFSKRIRTQYDVALRHLDPRAHRDVARALQHHRARGWPTTSTRTPGARTTRPSPTRPSSWAPSPGSSSCSWASSG